jgi:hypothetical protein
MTFHIKLYLEDKEGKKIKKDKDKTGLSWEKYLLHLLEIKNRKEVI